ncbi:uncharacterized protein LOC124438539 [Xenia sp. Carnegie-2017]|uniref:uncharacterized protein LOC124438539 n=1 Tax=Xenia sp. Carnegie-2017 TaxID=2897299 RepID=UPI001F04C11C|nr:uncharacterized protein LOC124438539 [Xenia sp. Carnegie-2017]
MKGVKTQQLDVLHGCLKHMELLVRTRNWHSNIQRGFNSFCFSGVTWVLRAYGFRKRNLIGSLDGHYGFTCKHWLIGPANRDFISFERKRVLEKSRIKNLCHKQCLPPTN